MSFRDGGERAREVGAAPFPRGRGLKRRPWRPCLLSSAHTRGNQLLDWGQPPRRRLVLPTAEALMKLVLEGGEGISSESRGERQRLRPAAAPRATVAVGSCARGNGGRGGVPGRGWWRSQCQWRRLLVRGSPPWGGVGGAAGKRGEVESASCCGGHSHDTHASSIDVSDENDTNFAYRSKTKLCGLIQHFGLICVNEIYLQQAHPRPDPPPGWLGGGGVPSDDRSDRL